MALITKILENKLYHWNAGAYNNKSDYWKISPMIGMMDIDCCGYIAVSYRIGKIVYSEPIHKYADYTRVHTRVYLFSCTKLRTCSKALNTRIFQKVVNNVKLSQNPSEPEKYLWLQQLVLLRQ